MADWVRTGYHGTDITCGDTILSSNKFLVSRDDEEWLGDGVYFFQYPADAKWWCSSIKILTDYYVLVAPLESDLNYVFDLDNPEDIIHFQEYAQKLGNRFKTRRDGEVRKLYNAVIIKQIQATFKIKGLKPFAIITGSFNQNRLFPVLSDKRFNVKPKQVQYCVCDQQCIKGIAVKEKVC